MLYMIIGIGMAGLRAAESIRRYDSFGRIIALSSEQEQPYARHLLPEVLAGERKQGSLLLRGPDFFSENQIELKLGETVEEIDANTCTVKTNRSKYKYDKLLIASGGRPLLPRLSLLNVNGVFVLRTLADARALDSYLKSENVKKAAVVGSGIVGLKVGYMLSRRGIEVCIVEKESRILPRVLDADSLVPVSRLCWENGFKIVLEERFREFLTSGKEKKLSHLVTYSGRSIPCEAAIMCPGMAANTALARSAGLKVRRGIVVDRFLSTSVENIYAAGDVIETLNAATSRTEVMPLWQNASEQGGVAGTNMAGKRVVYAGAIWENSLEIFGLKVVSLGQSHLVEKVRGAKVMMSPQFKKGRGLRLVFSRDRLIGATLLGEMDTAEFYKNLIIGRFAVWNFRDELLSEDFNPSSFQLRTGMGEDRLLAPG